MPIFDRKTINCQVEDAQGKQREIRVNVFLAEILRKHLPDDFQTWLETKYKETSQSHPGLSSKAIGNLVRGIIQKEAEKSPHYQAALEEFKNNL